MSDRANATRWTRRQLLVGAAATAGLSGAIGTAARAQGPRRLKIGYVSPQTGPLAPFGEADKFVIDEHPGRVQGRPRDRRQERTTCRSSSRTASPTRTAPARWRNDLILKDKVDLMLVGGTPETANPVSDPAS